MSKHVTTGEKFRFGARTYNDLNRLIDQDRQSSLLMQGRSARGAVDWVRVKNTSGTDVGRFGVLGIAGILFDPATALPAFVSRTVFTGEMPAETHQTGRFLICAEPIKNGAIGRAWADGIVTVRVEVLEESHQYATVKPDETTQLVSADLGLCTILYKEAGTGTKWAVVRFGSSSGNSLRWAFCSEAAGLGNTLDCYLDTDGTGTLVTVHFKLLNCTSLEAGHLSLTAGVPIPVMQRDGNWWCIIPVEGTKVVV